MLRYPSCDENQMLYASVLHVYVNRAGNLSQFFKTEEAEPELVLQ